MIRPSVFPALLGALLLSATAGHSQSVLLPAPRLLTTMPMGGQAGKTVEVTVTGEYIENVTGLLFSTPKITAKPVTDEAGKPVENKFLVTISPDTPVGVHDVRVNSRLGVSSARAFSVGTLPEQTRTEANNSLETAMAVPVNSIANATMTQREIDYYSFEGKKGQRLVIECVAAGIDSKLMPVLIVADEKGRDLMVNRTGGIIDFRPPADGNYIVKVNDLTFQGSGRHFYRLAVQQVEEGILPPRQPSTARVSSTSWPPPGLAAKAAGAETEPNNEIDRAQKIALPCDIEGSFYPAADVDTFEFTAKKGEEWWVEVASERMGLPTDPFVFVQGVVEKDGEKTLVDVAELYDIASPLKISTNGYSYDGPPYDIGSPDVLGKMEIKEDGTYRLQVRDLFGGTRNEPGNRYRLLVRRVQPDFALAGWAVHMTLRNGDRAAFSKPMALRAGGAKTLEVLAIRRDGFDGEIELKMEGLPAGVRASGLRIPKGKSVGHVVVTADEDAKPGFAMASITGTATIDGKPVSRPCRLASMEWPVKDAKQEIPSPRLVSSIPVSVSDSEKSPLTLAADEKTWEVTEGEKLTIPLKGTWRGDFTGTSIKLKAYGTGFDRLKPFEMPLKAESHDVVLDLAELKTPPGEYTVAFYGGAVAKYQYNPDAVPVAEAEQKKAKEEADRMAAEAKKLTEAVAKAPAEKKAEAEKAAQAAAEKKKQADAAMAAAEKKAKAVTSAAAPKDIVDIYVSRPIRISVKAKPAEPAATTAQK